MLEEQLDDFDAVLLAGDVQRGEPVKSPGVGVSLAIQQQLSHADVTAVGGHVECRQVIHSHLKCPSIHI